MTGTHYELFTRPGRHDRDWMTRAQCRIDGTAAEIRANADKYFPASNNHHILRAAEQLCEGCPVTAECAQHAEQLGIDYGIWGAHSRQKTEQRGARSNCGTEKAYYRHIEHGEPVDEACQAAAQRAWERRRNHRNRTKRQT